MTRILWTQKQDAGPRGRAHQAMAYDSNRGRTVLFGGTGGADVGSLGDTWEWDGENWTQMADSGPPAREQAAMAYDVQRNQTVLFGGLGPGGFGGSDTWGWDGSNWTQLAVSGPLPRTNFGMAYDSKRQRIVVFGGLRLFAGGALLADTWEWDGAAWTELAVTGPAVSTSTRSRRLGTLGSGTVLCGRRSAISASYRVCLLRSPSRETASRCSVVRATRHPLLKFLGPPGRGMGEIGRCGRISDRRHGMHMPCAKEARWFYSEDL